MVSGLLDQLLMLLQLYLIEYLGLLIGLGVLKWQYFIYQRLLMGFGMLVFLKNFNQFVFFLVLEGFEWFWIGCLHKNIQLLLEFLKTPFLVLHVFYYTLIFLMMLFVICLSKLMILLSTLSMIRYLICCSNQSWLLNLNLIFETLWTGAGSDLLISVLEKLSFSHLSGLIALVVLV